MRNKVPTNKARVPEPVCKYVIQKSCLDVRFKLRTEENDGKVS